MGDFLLGIQREKMPFGSVFFVSRAVARGSEILRRVPQQIWCQKNTTFSSCPFWYIYTQSLTTERRWGARSTYRHPEQGMTACSDCAGPTLGVCGRPPSSHGCAPAVDGECGAVHATGPLRRQK